MTRFVPLSDIIEYPLGSEHALLITNRQDIDANTDSILAQSEKEEKRYTITGISEPDSLRKGYTIYFLSEPTN